MYYTDRTEPETVEVQKAKLREAEKAVEVVVKKINEEISAATAAIQAKYHDEFTAVRQAREDAIKAGEAARDALPKHEWTGQPIGRSWGGSKVETRRIAGMVEMCRTDTEFPSGQRWRLPTTGQPFVRLLKKNGEPGMKFERLVEYDGTISKEWKLVEGWTP